MIQHRAIRYIFDDYSPSSSVSNMLSKLNLPTLQKRRQISSLTMFYKIKHNLNLNLNSLLVKRQIDNPSPGAMTGGN